jgi:hypothetical protein
MTTSDSPFLLREKNPTKAEQNRLSLLLGEECTAKLAELIRLSCCCEKKPNNNWHN